MIIDLIILIIVALSAYIGKKKGFAATVINFIKWIAIIILGLIFTKPVKEYLLGNTNMDEWLTEKLQATIMETTDFDITKSLPGNISDINEPLASSVATSVIEVFMTLISFLFVLIFVVIIAALLSAIFSKKHNKDNFIGTTDGFIGLAFGLLRGAVIVCILLAIMVPVTSLIAPEQLPLLNKSLDTSYIALLIYDNNPLLLFLNNVL
ncbi:MAG TPA: CvpA family protein [Anaerovoracaceae bacterium]|nr:CvpA family protein [Anaerovoracaceae bacterium]